VKSVGACAHVEDCGDRAEIEFAIEMRNSFVIARRLPAQRITQRIPSTAIRNNPVWPKKCFFAVSATWEAVEKWMNPSRRSSALAANAPRRSARARPRRTDFVNRAHRPVSLLAAKVFWALTGFSGFGRKP